MGMIAPDVDENYTATLASTYDMLSPPAVIRVLTPEEFSKQNIYWMITGSGSLGVLMDIGSGADTIVQRSMPAAHPKTEHSLSTTLDEIADTFALTKDQLADCLLVSRKTIYNWIDGTASPQHANLNRLYELKLLCKDWQYRKLFINKPQLSEPVVNSKSVMELLKAEKLDRDQILFAGSRLGLENIGQRLSDPFV
jgi:DNA-binding transcriptional regulator YiaG